MYTIYLFYKIIIKNVLEKINYIRLKQLFFKPIIFYHYAFIYSNIRNLYQTYAFYDEF